MESNSKSKNEIIEETDEELLEGILNTDLQSEAVALMLKATVYAAREAEVGESGLTQKWALQEIIGLQEYFEELALQEKAEKEGERITSLNPYAKRAFLADLVLEAVNAHESYPVMKSVGRRLNRIDFMEMSKVFTKITGKTWSQFTEDRRRRLFGAEEAEESLFGAEIEYELN